MEIEIEVEVISCNHCRWHGDQEECAGSYDEVLGISLNFCPKCGSNNLKIIRVEVIKQE